MLELTHLTLFMNSAKPKRMNAVASTVRRSEKARFLFIIYGLIGEKFSINWRGNDGNDKKNHRTRDKGQRHVYVHEHHCKHEPNYEI